MDLEEIKAALAKPNKSNSGLAKVLGIPNSGVTALLKGGRRIRADEVAKIEAYLGIGESAPIPIRGFVGGGGEVEFYELDEDRLRKAPPIKGSTPKTIALIVNGPALGPLLERAAIYYEDTRSTPTQEMMGKLCVVGLSDGRVLIRKLQESRLKKRFHLILPNVDPIMDSPVEWASLISTSVLSVS